MAFSNITKSILVTGGAGFLGSHLCERLLRDQGANPRRPLRPTAANGPSFDKADAGHSVHAGRIDGEGGPRAGSDETLAGNAP